MIASSLNHINNNGHVNAVMSVNSVTSVAVSEFTVTELMKCQYF